MPNERGERPCARASSRSRHVGRVARRQDAEDRRRSRRNFPLAPGPQDLLGCWSKACQSRRKAAFRFIWRRVAEWRRSGLGANAAGRRGNLEKMRVASHGDEDARHSVTYYAIVDKAAPRLAWLSMKPVTGRTHQLRAHAEAIGHPIIGDPKYGMSGDNDPRAQRSAARRYPTASSASCICGAASRSCRIRAAARSTSPRPCRRICKGVRSVRFRREAI